MDRAVWVLLAVAGVSWGIGWLYPASNVHFGWIGTLLASSAGLIATISSYRTEEKVHSRGGGVIFRSESPIKFFIAYVSVGLFLVFLAFASIVGLMGRLS